MIEDKLRINFKRWLELADEKQQTSQVFRKYIIVVVDGIDKLKESSGKEELPEWLPNGIPNNVKIVVTCNKNSRSYNYLINKVSSHILIEPFDIDKRLELFEYYTRKLDSSGLAKYDTERLKNYVISNESCENVLFLTLLLHFCLLTHSFAPAMNYSLIENIYTVEELFEAAIDFYSANGFNNNIIKKVLGYLSVTRCGLTIEELIKTTSHSESVLNVLEVFIICLFNYDNL